MLHYWGTCDAFCTEMLAGSHGTKAAGSTVVVSDVTFHPVQGRAPGTTQRGWVLALHVGIWRFITFRLWPLWTCTYMPTCDTCRGITRQLSSKSLTTYSCGCSFTCPKPVGTPLKMRHKWSRARCCGPPCPGVATERIKPLPAAAKRHFTWAPKCKTKGWHGMTLLRDPVLPVFGICMRVWSKDKDQIFSHQLIWIDLR